VVESGRTQPFEQPVGPFGVDLAATSAGDVTQRMGEVGFADPDSDGDRLQHLRSVLPSEVRVVAETHPLFGRLLEASSFKRIDGVWHLVVGLPDGSPGTIAAGATDVFGEVRRERNTTVLSVDGARQLQALVVSLHRDGPRRGRRSRSRETGR
jgi:hypothetical protein